MKASFKQSGYNLSIGGEFRDDALNILIECFDESSKRIQKKKPGDVERIINYCESRGKKVAVIMTEHIDYIDNIIHAYSVPLGRIDKTHYNPAVKQRILSLLTLSPYIKYIFTLGEYPKLKNFREMISKTPIMIPYPQIKKVDVGDNMECDLIFSGRDTKYRSRIIEGLRMMSFSVKDNAYQKILNRRQRNQLISKAKINLNIPQDENWKYPSILRIILALSLGKMTVSIEDQLPGESSGNFYARVGLSNLNEVSSYLRESGIFYGNYLQNYNEIASRARFPEEHFRIWGEAEGVIR
ncbi:MAG: hypothetical protein KGP29_00820 [Proteobacteria bacterium]|nr:hypothetical protein [Pseudomonadota bacterium]